VDNYNINIVSRIRFFSRPLLCYEERLIKGYDITVTGEQVHDRSAEGSASY
jgi:hypothetical protein